MKSREHHARADLLARFDVLAQLGEVVNGVGEIANGGDAGGDVEERVVGD